uniref:Uncharacterized protein MANES_05G042100 n=1 Tax=Rhizophora mucronata TaxID=61149 RepID=A0A2P2MF32_RHIMU
MSIMHPMNDPKERKVDKLYNTYDALEKSRRRKTYLPHNKATTFSRIYKSKRESCLSSPCCWGHLFNQIS